MRTSTSITRLAVVSILLMLPYANLNAKMEVRQFLEQNCAGKCHNLDGPGPDSVKALWKRNAPDLSYAGDKFQKEWLISWLQAPYRLRPAGMLYSKNIKPGEDGDEIDRDTIPQSHIALSKDHAIMAATELMIFQSEDKKRPKGKYKEGTISISMGELMFDKFKGCMACHEIEPGYGGLSGPEVYTAAKRLQYDFIVRYLRNHQAWESTTIMPNRRLKEKDIQKFVHYLRALAKEIGKKGEALEKVALKQGTHSFQPSQDGSNEKLKKLSLTPEEKAADVTISASENYKTFCWQCHGIQGDGQGINVRDMSVQPRDHTDAVSISSRSDEELFKAIKLGGQAVNKSVLMPPWGDLLKDEEINGLVKYLRYLCQCKYGD